MRITFFVGRPDLGGGARVVATYAERLQRRGHEVVVIARPPRKPTLRERLRSTLRGRELPAQARPSPSHFENKSFEFRLLDRFRPATAADAPDADVVIAAWWETAEWIADFPASKGAKVYFVQGYESFASDPARLEATWRLPIRKIVVAQWLKNLARDRFGDDDVTLVPNSVDLEQFSVPPRSKQTIPTIGLMYSAVTVKGCEVSLEAYRLAAERVKGLQLVTFDSRPPVGHLPLPGGAHFVLNPAQDKIKDLYGRCDAWLWASRSEGFGLPILEAMACRTPVIATPAGAAPELVGQGGQGGGILVPPDDPAAMAEAVVEICGLSSAAWRAMSDKAYATASRYTWEDATDRFEAALRVACQSPGAACDPREAAVA